jgi:diguanylate cyclase (GGDEF)-like protein
MPDDAGQPKALETHEPSEPPVRPAAARTARDRYYSTRLRQLAHLDLDEADAERLWRDVGRHRHALEHRLGRDVGQRVALLDYVVNVRPRLVEPQIVERTTLEVMARRAIADALTGLFNRHHFDTQLVREVERCRRYGAAASLVLLDLDQFKGINDGWGHAVGDEVLRKVGARILAHVRGADVACRYGGDEFAIILPDTPASEALVVADRIRADIGNVFTREPVGHLHLVVTASGGLATYGPGITSCEQLVEAADRALYRAKAAGGGRVVALRSDAAARGPAA